MPDIGNTSVFSQTDASNNTATMPGWNGSAAPSTLDDAGRAIQGAITRDWNWRNYTLTSTGAANAYVLTYTVAPAAYYTGSRFAFITNFGVTGTATVNVNTLGAKTIKKDVAGVLTALSSGDIASGQYIDLVYNGTDMIWVNWQGPTAVAFTGGVLTTTTSMSGKGFSEAKGAAVASAGTTDIWTPADGNYVHVTGVTTITSLGTAPQAGAERTVIFDGALTLTHNATTLVLPGGVSITTAANDRMIVRADTTANMIVVDYVKASGLPVVVSSTRTLLATLTTTSGTTQSATGLSPSSYRYYEIELVGVSFTTNPQLTLAASGNNGSNYGTATAVGPAGISSADTLDGTIFVYGINILFKLGGYVQPYTSSSGAVVSYNTAANLPKNTTGATGAIDALQFAGGTFDAGTIRIYGVL